MKNNLATLIIGISVGVLLGLSETEILEKVLLPVFTLIVGILSILAGYRKTDGATESRDDIKKLITQINLLPVMFLIVGMVGGAFIGLYAKNHDVTSPPPTITENLTGTPPSQNVSQESRTVLKNLSKTFCEDRLLCDLRDWDLLCQVSDADNITIKKLLDPRTVNLDSLTAKIHKLCSCND